MTARLLAIAALVLAPRLAGATRYAIVIGDNASETADVPRLRYADDDAVAMHTLLVEAGVHSKLFATLDADTRRRYPAIQPDGPATWTALQTAFAGLEREVHDDAAAGRDPELYVFFSGHGDVSHGEGYVVLEDGRLTRGRLRELLGKTSPARQHVVIDACRSYFLAFDKGGNGKRTHLDRRIVEDERGVPAGVGFILSTSSDRDSHEWDRFQGGVFSYEVRSALRGAADANGDGVISYAELGAFLTVANQSIPNERFRPDFFVRPPTGERTALRAPLLAWEAGRAGVVADEPARHFYIEDGAGTRLLDAHPAPDQRLVVRLPAEEPLFVRTDDDTEIVLAAATPRISAGTHQAPSITGKGALHLAFEHLFAAPFGAASVDAFEQSWAPPSLTPELPAAEPPHGSPVRRIAAWTFVGAASLGVSFQLIALERYVTAQNSSQVERHQRNQQIDRLDLGAYVLYGIAGIAGATWLGTTLWHDDHGHQVGVAVAPSGLTVLGRF